MHVDVCLSSCWIFADPDLCLSAVGGCLGSADGTCAVVSALLCGYVSVV